MTLLREHPWHLPSSTIHHHQWFKNLTEFHDLTLCWLKEIHNQSTLPEHAMTRGLSHDISENLWMLESLSTAKIDPLLDDTSPDDVLGRLERTVWIVQAWTVQSLMDRTIESERASLNTLLEQVCWKHGKKIGEERWKRFPNNLGHDLKALLQAVIHTPFFPRNSFLLKRSTDRELIIEHKTCPHRVPYAEVAPVADRLCDLHHHWLRGYTYVLNPLLLAENTTLNGRCELRMSFTEMP